jgi:hypothetical protein
VLLRSYRSSNGLAPRSDASTLVGVAVDYVAQCYWLFPCFAFDDDQHLVLWRVCYSIVGLRLFTSFLCYRSNLEFFFSYFAAYCTTISPHAFTNPTCYVPCTCSITAYRVALGTSFPCSDGDAALAILRDAITNSIDREPCHHGDAWFSIERKRVA